MGMMNNMFDHHHHHQDNHNRQFQSSSSQRSDLDDHVGPTTISTPRTTTNDILCDVAAPVVFGGGAAVRTLQPFYTPSSTTIAVPYNAFKSPGLGGGMAASVGFPFTNAQLKELERQAMIYKYMVSSVPVPLELLLPFTRNLSASALSYPQLGSQYKIRFSNGTDAEPGRCKRTDGKKWRCSRDVAPDQKYCERHMHRGRPRSRKPVEVQVNNNNKRSRHDNQIATTLATTSNIIRPSINNNHCPQNHFLGSSSAAAALPYHPSPVFVDKSAFESVPSLSADKEGRSLDWMMKGEAIAMAASDPRWLHLMQTRIEIPSKPSFCDTNNTSIYAEQEPFLNLNSYANFSTGEDQHERECALFLNPEAVSLDNHANSETPRSFIDAWSKTAMEKTMAHSHSINQNSVSSERRLSPSSLTLSMGGSGSISDGMSRAQIGSGFSGSDANSHVTRWLTPASWVASSPGGPLAEVLRPSSVTATTSAASDPSSPFAANGDSGSHPGTLVSSPSGVLQKTPATLSDSSSCSSPALGRSKIKAEIALL